MFFLDDNCFFVRQPGQLGTTFFHNVVQSCPSCRPISDHVVQSCPSCRSISNYGVQSCHSCRSISNQVVQSCHSCRPYNSCIAIFAQASASANAWWWLVIGQPQASATVCSWWLGKRRPKWRREARQVQRNW